MSPQDLSQHSTPWRQPQLSHLSNPAKSEPLLTPWPLEALTTQNSRRFHPACAPSSLFLMLIVHVLALSQHLEKLGPTEPELGEGTGHAT